MKALVSEVSLKRDIWLNWWRSTYAVIAKQSVYYAINGIMFMMSLMASYDE